MTSEKKETGWHIPTNLSFEPFKKVLGAFYQKNAETQEVTTKIIANTVGMNNKSISGSIRFLSAIKIIEGEQTKGYKLTPKGAEYAKSIYKEDKEAIKNSCSEIIKNSYLKTLVDYISVNKTDLSVDGLYKFIRAEGKFPQGKGPTGMTAANATGAKTLLQIFNSANFFPDEFNLSAIIETSPKVENVKKKTQSRVKKTKSSTKKVRSSTELDTSSDEMANANFDDFSMSMRKGIDHATFNFIKTQIKSTLEFWETKYIQTKNQSEDKELDKSQE